MGNVTQAPKLEPDIAAEDSVLFSFGGDQKDHAPCIDGDATP